ncbi:hypothetical protein BKA83DRAFT_21324, partial [Pisolithus microcarpus]
MPLAFKLFGDNTYPDSNPMILIPTVRSIIDHLLVNMWHCYCKALSWESKDITKKEASLGSQWQVLHHYQDADLLAQLEEKQKCIKAMLAAAQNDDSKLDEIT